MRLKGVVYDVGRVLSPIAGTWRPDYSPQLVQRELDIIKTDLHCTAVRICGRDPQRVIGAATYALEQGLHVWLSPELWNDSPERTRDYLVRVAMTAQPLWQRWPDRIIFSLGNELTLFMRGIVPGRSYARRSQLPVLREIVKSGAHTPPLRRFLTEAVPAVRRVYDGPISYSSLPIEDVDWELFDIVGINYYRNTANASRYLSTLERLQGLGKPVMVTEFGFPACADADDPAIITLGFNTHPVRYAVASLASRLLVGPLRPRPRVATLHIRDETRQAQLLLEHLTLLDHADVDGAFIMSFSFPIATYDPDPRYDLDATALSLVRTLPRGQRGTTYPDMPWEPKKAFRAAADYYNRH